MDDFILQLKVVHWEHNNMPKYLRSYTAIITGIAEIEAESIEDVERYCKTDQEITAVKGKETSVEWNDDTRRA